jgi:predicted RNase H-like nuclease
MRVTGVDACRRGWVAVTLEGAGRPAGQPDSTERAGRDAQLPGTAPIRVGAVRVHETLAGVLDAGVEAAVVGIDMPLGLLESGWREADRAARGLLGPRRSAVFAIPPRAVWAQASYQAASRLCRELTGQGFSIQAWGLRAKLLEAGRYRDSCRHPLYEVHPELAFSAMAGAPLAHSKHTAAGRDVRRELLSRAGIALPADAARLAPVTDVMDAAAVAWSAWRIAAGRAVVVPARPQRDGQGCPIAIRY